VCDEAGSGAAACNVKLLHEDGADLRLRLRDGEVERERRNLLGGTFLADERLPDLGTIAVRDDERLVG